MPGCWNGFDTNIIGWWVPSDNIVLSGDFRRRHGRVQCTRREQTFKYEGLTNRGTILIARRFWALYPSGMRKVHPAALRSLDIGSVSGLIVFKVSWHQSAAVNLQH